MRSWGKWVSEIREPKKRSRIWLGSYSTPEAAAQAYDMALYYLRGPLATLNFPGRIPTEDPPPAMSPKSVQKAAIAAGLAADKNLSSNSRAVPASSAESMVTHNLSNSDSSPHNSVHSHHDLAMREALRPRQQCKSEVMDLASINLNERAPLEGEEREEEGYVYSAQDEAAVHRHPKFTEFLSASR